MRTLSLSLRLGIAEMAREYSLMPADSPEVGRFSRSYDPEEQVRRYSRFALIAVVILAVFFIGATTFVPIGGAVIAQGELDAATRVKRVAHPSGGTIAQLFVKNGDQVAKGQVLLRFEDAVAGSDASSSMLTYDQMRAQRARLEAERLGASRVTFDYATPADTAGARKAIADEAKLFQIRQAEEAGLIAQLNQRIVQYRRQILGYQRQIDSLIKQQTLIAPERDGLESLYQRGLVTLSRRNQLARTMADLDGSIGSLQAQIAQAQARISETREQIIQAGETHRSEAGTKLGELNAQLNQQQARSVATGDVANRMVVRAPSAGIVDKLAYAASGELVKPGDMILEIVPSGEAMVVQASVAPIDVDQVEVGQVARVRFSTLNSALVPEAMGHVIAVAPDRTVDSTGQRAFYPVRVRLDDLGFAKRYGVNLRAGMPSEVFLSTGSRSMISYLTKPIHDQLTRSFRDNN